jgi:hypothetical protein
MHTLRAARTPPPPPQPVTARDGSSADTTRTSGNRFATGIASVECTNPGGNVAPGQDTEVDVSGSFGPFTADKNGNFRFPTLTTAAPPNPSGADACPNAAWTAAITDVEFTTPATISIIQGGVVVATTEVDIT